MFVQSMRVRETRGKKSQQQEGKETEDADRSKQPELFVQLAIAQR